MTRYLCADIRHRRGTDPRTIDMTAAVRLERELQPRSAVYLTSTERILASVPSVSEADEARRVEAVREVLAGAPYPGDAVVIVASERSVVRAPGLYELDELVGSEPWIERLVGAQQLPSPVGNEDVFVLEERPDTRDALGEPSLGEHGHGDLLVARASDTRVLPQGIYDLDVLAGRLARAATDEPSLVEAIRRTPRYAETVVSDDQSWRVVLACPGLDGVPSQRHQIAFTGTGRTEPTTVYGTPVDGWDAVIESAVGSDLAPPLAVARMERRVKALILAELSIAALLFALAWASGALARAARETPGWLAFAVVLLLGGLVFAATPLFAPSEADGNANDTLVIRRFYRSRLEMLGWGAAISAALFALSIGAALVPGLAIRPSSLPAAAVTFDSGSQPITAMVTFAADDISTEDTLVMDVRQFGPGDQVGTLIGHVTTSGNADGQVNVVESIAMDAGARYVSVGIRSDSGGPLTCGPSTGVSGCTVVAVPPLGAGIAPVAQVPVPAVVPSTAPAPSASATPATPSPTI